VAVPKAFFSGAFGVFFGAFGVFFGAVGGFRAKNGLFLCVAVVLNWAIFTVARENIFTESGEC